MQTSSIKTEFALKNYSYSFIWKTISWIQQDWWTLFLNSSYAQITAYWLSSINAESIMIKQENLSSILPNAKSVELQMTVSLLSSDSAYRISMYRTADQYSRADVSWPWISRTQSQTTVYWTNYTDSHSSSSTLTITTTFDFVNKTWKTETTNWYSRNWTLSDTQISNIKNNSKWLYLSASWWSWWIWSMRIIVK